MRVLIALGVVLACAATMRSAGDPAVSEAGRQSLSAFLKDAVARGEVPGVVMRKMSPGSGASPSSATTHAGASSYGS